MYKVLPAIIIKDNKVFIPEKMSLENNVDAFSAGPFVFITKDYWKDSDVIIHELQHTKQRYRGLFVVNALRLYFDTNYKIFVEYEAFNTMSTSYTNSEVAQKLSGSVYELDKSKKEIEEILKTFEV